MSDGLDTRLSKVERRQEGASIAVRDPRVSTAFTWVSGVFASVTVLVMVWVASSINDLNKTMARVATQNESIMTTLVDHSERLRELERRNAPR